MTALVALGYALYAIAVGVFVARVADEAEGAHDRLCDRRLVAPLPSLSAAGVTITTADGPLVLAGHEAITISGAVDAGANGAWRR